MKRSVLIVGAGPTGLTAAVELARQRIVPNVIEKRSGPSGLSRAVVLAMMRLVDSMPALRRAAARQLASG